MVSLSRIGLVLATGCKSLLTDFLRGEVGMVGYCVSDMWTLEYNKQQLPLFLMAGLDIPDGATNNVGTDWSLYETGYSALAWRMRESAKRTMYATLHSNAMNGFDSNTKIIRVTPKWEKQANILLGVVSTVWGACLAWGVAEVVLAVKKSRLLKK